MGLGRDRYLGRNVGRKSNYNILTEAQNRKMINWKFGREAIKSIVSCYLSCMKFTVAERPNPINLVKLI